MLVLETEVTTVAQVEDGQPTAVLTIQEISCFLLPTAFTGAFE
jgi:hypothetical protein